MFKDDFIGKTYNNLKGNIISIVRCVNKESLLEQRLYVCTCSLCSKDSELWPEGSLVLSRRGIREGRTNCSCAGVKYSLSQWKILVNRKAIELGCEVLKVYITERKRRALRLDYKSLSGKVVKNVSVEHFMKRGFVEKGYLRDDTYYIDEYFSNNVIIDKIFCREDSQHWKFKCLSCEKTLKSLDVEQGAIFTTKGGSLLKGSVGCLCNSKVSLTEDYLIANAKKVLSSNGNEFISSESFNKTRTYIHWKCSSGHLNRTYYSNIVCGKGCKGCRSLNSGNALYTKYLDREDYLYFMTLKEKDGTQFYKVGRSFNMQSRLNSVRVIYDSAEITYFIKSTHRYIHPLEDFIKSYLRSNSLHYLPVEYFAGCITECFKTDDLHQIISLSEKEVISLKST